MLWWIQDFAGKMDCQDDKESEKLIRATFKKIVGRQRIGTKGT